MSDEKPVDELHAAQMAVVGWAHHADKIEEIADGLRQELGKSRHETERCRRGWAQALAENRVLQKVVDEQTELIRRNSSPKVAEMEALIEEIRGLVSDE